MGAMPGERPSSEKGERKAEKQRQACGKGSWHGFRTFELFGAFRSAVLSGLRVLAVLLAVALLLAKTLSLQAVKEVGRTVAGAAEGAPWAEQQGRQELPS